MEHFGKDSCYFEGRVYPSGSEVHSEIYRMVCRNGQWQDMDEGFDDSEPALPHFYH